MPILFGGMLEGAIIGGVAGLLVGLGMAIFGPKRRCPECNEKLPIAWIKPPKTCPHCDCELPPPGKPGKRR